MASPKEVDDVNHKICYTALSPLNVNQNIGRDWRWLPRQFQGLGMFNLNIDCLGACVYYLRQHWGMDTAPAALLLQAYEAFMMDVGLGSNIFEWDYNKYGKLAEHSWFCLPWELCHKYKVHRHTTSHCLVMGMFPSWPSS